MKNRNKIMLVQENEKLVSEYAFLLYADDYHKAILHVINKKYLKDLIKKAMPNFVIIGIEGFEAARFDVVSEILNMYPHIQIFSFLDYYSRSDISNIEIQKIRCFVGTEDLADDLGRGVRTLCKAGVFVTINVIDFEYHYLDNYLEPKRTLDLNNLELFLLEGICKGQSSKELGERLHRSHRTIEEHRDNLYKKFDVRTKAQPISKAYKEGFFKNV